MIRNASHELLDNNALFHESAESLTLDHDIIEISEISGSVSNLTKFSFYR